MVFSWTPLFVLFDLGLPAGHHKPAAKIATKPFPAAANGKNPFRRRLPNRTEFPVFTGSSSPARRARVPELTLRRCAATIEPSDFHTDRFQLQITGRTTCKSR